MTAALVSVRDSVEPSKNSLSSTGKQPHPIDLAERNALIESHLSYAYGIAFSCGVKADSSDLRSAAHVALVSAAGRYRPESGAPFSSYLVKRVVGACLELTRRSHRKHSACIQLERVPPVASADGNVRSLMPRKSLLLWEQELAVDQSPCMDERLIAMERHRRLWAAVADLPIKSRTVIMLRYRWDMDTADICQVVGLKPNRVNQIHRSAIGALKAVMEAR